jgi:CRP-like cAMP-binding protein
LTEPTLPPTHNLLLAALPDDDFERLAPHLEAADLTRGEVLMEPRTPATRVFFPTAGLVSVLLDVAGERSMEIATIGNEGMVGTSALLEGPGSISSSRRAVVQVPGHAYCLPAEQLAEEFARGGKLRDWVLRYLQALITQVAQIAACNRHHQVEAQLCRWLLYRFDRLESRDLEITHKEIAELLGVRREAVTEACGVLQNQGLIRWGRGRVQLLDRAALEVRVCECLGVIQKEYTRLLGT